MDSFEIEVVGSAANFSIKVRDGLPISSVTHLAIEAELSVRAIHIPVENMPRNLRLSLGSGAKVGDMYYIRGQPTEEAKRFVINWQNGPAKMDDVLFQLNPRLDEGRITTNSRMDDEMGDEESSDNLPLTPGSPFELVVGVFSLAFETRLDGKEWCSFKHRQDVAQARTLFLEGDFQPTHIHIDSAQLNPPTLPLNNGKSIKSRGVRLQLMCPEVPVHCRVTGGFEKGCLFLISGKLHTNPSRLQVDVQCGAEEECDVALRYSVEWEVDGSPKITLNSREEDAWGQRAKAEEVTESLLPGTRFDLIIYYSEDGFRCFLDGREHAAHLPYRLEDPRPDHVTVSGDAEVQMLLLL